MKKMFILAVLACVTLGAAAQQVPTKAERKAERQAARAQSRAESSAMLQDQHRKALQALELNSFLVRFDRVYFRHGGSAYLTPITNFLSVEGSQVTLQIIIDPSSIGPNSLGGITLEGLATEVSTKQSKKGVTFFHMLVNGHSLSCSVDLTLPSEGNLVRAEIVSTFHNMRLSLEGSLQPYDKTAVIKGRAF